jgi:hypothetical protein
MRDDVVVKAGRKDKHDKGTMTRDWLSHTAAESQKAALNEAYTILQMWKTWVFKDTSISGFGSNLYDSSDVAPPSTISDELGEFIDAVIASLGRYKRSIIRRALLGSHFPPSPKVFDEVLMEFYHEFKRADAAR